MKIKYFDKAIELLFFVLMFLIPVIFDRRIGIVFSGTKSVTIRLLLILILTIWAVKLLVGGKHNFRRTLLDWPVLTYLLVASAATITSVHVLLSFFGFYGRYEGLITWYCYGLMFFIATNYLLGFKKLKQFIALIMTVSTTMAIYGIIQRQGIDPYVWGGVVTWQRVIATIGQPNFLAGYVDMAFFITMFFILTSSGKEKDKAQVVIKEIKTDKNKKNKLLQQKKLGFDQEFYSKANKIFLSILSFILVPLVFILMIYSQTGENVFLWYFFFIVMTSLGVYFAYTYECIPDVLLNIIAIASLVLNYICLFYTQSRGGYIGFAVGLILLLVLIPRKRLFENWKIISIVFVVFLGVTLITAVNPEYSPFARFTGEIRVGNETSQQGQPSQDKQSESKSNTVELGGAAGSRGETWKSAFGIISDNPVFGIGPEVLKMVFPRYETDLFRFKEAFHVKQDRCHNETFDIPTTKGLITLFVYLLIIFLVYKYGIHKMKAVDDDKKVFIAVVLSAMASYIIQNQFSFGVIAITSLFWVLWALVLNVDTHPHSTDQDDRTVSFDNVPWLYFGGLILFVLFLMYISMLQFEADKYFKSAKNFMDMKRFSESLPEFKTSIKFFPIEGGTITNYGIALLNAVSSSPLQDQAKLQKESLDVFAYGMKVDPYNADNLYISSRIYLMRNNLTEAYDYSIKTLKIDPYYAEAHLTLAEIAVRQGDQASAKKHNEEAYRINPSLSEPKIKIAFSKFQENKLDEAFKLFQELLLSDPKNPNVHNGLGLIYMKQGNSKRAKEEFEQTLILDPNNSYAKKMLGK